MIVKISTSVICLWCSLVTPVRGQSSTYPYVIENLENGTVARRGISDSRGIASSELILQPNAQYRIWVLESTSLRVGILEFQTPSNGQNFSIPPIAFRNPITPDTDADGLHDEAEFILGTLANNRDSDGDGIADGPEFEQGLDPLDGLVAVTGIVANADTPGISQDVFAFENYLAVADGTGGISVFNAFNGMAPLIVARISVPGGVYRLHGSKSLLVACDTNAGLLAIDLQDPPNASIIQQVSIDRLGSRPACVLSEGGFAYTGLENGDLVVVDLRSGFVLDRISLSDKSIEDLAFAQDAILALTRGTLFAINLLDLRLTAVVPCPGAIGAANRRWRLFAGFDVAYATHATGYNTFNITNPTVPILIAAGATNQFGWKQIVANGSGLGVAAVSPNSTNDGEHHISLYNLDNPNLTNQFLTTFETPGLASAVTIFNGTAYVSDSEAGLQVLNYLSYDSHEQPPSIEIFSNLNLEGNQVSVVEGQPIRISAKVDDDVQVRNVELIIDGAKVSTDGSFPFEFRFNAPTLNQNGRFQLVLRASDTGGNISFSDPINFLLLPDTQPPRVIQTSPYPDSTLRNVESLSATFSEAIQENTINGTNWSLAEAGTDGIFNTQDDQIVTGGEFSYREPLQTAVWQLSEPLEDGHYQSNMSLAIMDLSGNGLSGGHTWTFTVSATAGVDSDGDGLPDDIEIILGLDPEITDSDNNGVPDDEEDNDGDGLSNGQELTLRTDPGNPDTDGDGLEDGAEFGTCTNPRNPDSDGDGFGDGEEVLDGLDPCDSNSTPNLEFGFRRAWGSSYSLLQMGQPETIDIPGYASNSLSVINSSWPGKGQPFDGIFSHTDQITFSVLNTKFPGFDENLAQFFNEVEGPFFSTLNEGEEPFWEVSDIRYSSSPYISVLNTKTPISGFYPTRAVGDYFSVLNQNFQVQIDPIKATVSMTFSILQTSIPNEVLMQKSTAGPPISIENISSVKTPGKESSARRKDDEK